LDPLSKEDPTLSTFNSSQSPSDGGYNLKDYNRIQIEEMMRHKWIESEKAGYDLGESCHLEWIRKHGAKFRKNFHFPT